MAKSITVPDPIKFKNIQGLFYEDLAMRFETYLELAIFNNAKLDNPKGWRWSAKIQGLVSAKTDQKTGKASEPVILDDEDWKALADLDADPGYVQIDQGQKVPVSGIPGYTSHICRQMLVFSDAIQNAVTV